MQIYIMDCDYEVMKKLETLINSDSKCQAKCFTTSQTLVSAVRRESPDTVIIDFDAKHGFSTAKIIRSESPATKIIMMSENQNKAIELYELGLNGFLLKPIDSEKVKDQLFCLRHPVLSKMIFNKERALVL